MSMNYFMCTFGADQIEAMMNDTTLVDRWVLQEPAYGEKTDIETSWDVLRQALVDVGFGDAAPFVDKVLFNGASLLNPSVVQAEAEDLATWSDDDVMAAITNLPTGGEDEAYHLEVWQEDDSVLDHFNTLKDFFARAAAAGQGMVCYIA
jgi:hypothetical protein